MAATLLLSIAAFSFSPVSHAGDSFPFQPGEDLKFEISWMGLIGGEGRLSVTEETELRNRKVYLLRIIARSTGWVRSLYPVDDKTVSYFDVKGNFSRKVEVSISENRYRKKKVIEFFQEKRKALYKVDDDPAEEFEIDESSQDSFSALYALRGMGANLKVGQVLEIPIFEDKQRYKLKVLVLRRERIELPLGLVDTVVVEPKLMTEGIFSRKGSMTVWLADDEHLTPVKMMSKVMIGSFKAVLKSYSGARINFIPKSP
ncbi:MAG: DUF3108 domain-containing protein [Nitrospinota bacterium]|nr:DUF3108 domain-containing protein [Nitrospinota bacterium]